MKIKLQKHELFQKLETLNLDPKDYIIMGSGVMFALGIRPLKDLDDIDIWVNKKGWKQVRNLA